MSIIFVFGEHLCPIPNQHSSEFPSFTALSHTQDSVLDRHPATTAAAWSCERVGNPRGAAVISRRSLLRQRNREAAPRWHRGVQGPSPSAPEGHEAEDCRRTHGPQTIEGQGSSELASRPHRPTTLFRL
jgi:hypothetical protein